MKSAALKNLLTLLTLNLFLAACTSLPSEPPSPQIPEADRWLSPEANTTTVQARWWDLFEDPLLSGLIRDAATQNHDIRLAKARLKEVQAAYRLETADGLPSIQGSGSAVRQSASENGASFIPPGTSDEQNVFGIDFGASWELDFFGAQRARAEAALARIERQEYQQQDVLRLVFAEVARNYLLVRSEQKRLAVLERNVALQLDTLEIVQARAEIGLSRQLDVTRAKAQLEQTRALIPESRRQQQQAAYQLALLTDRSREALTEQLMTTQPLPSEPDVVPVGLPSELLQRRPDIRSAEAQLRATFADWQSAQRDLYPSFSLTGSAGLESLTIGELLKGSSGTWAIGAVLRWPIFQQGRLRATIDVQEARKQQALIQYERTVLSAFQEVGSTLISYGESLAIRARLQSAVEAAQESAELAEGLYQQGLSSFIEVLDANLRLTQSEDELVRAETRALVELINLYQSLGGGWEQETVVADGRT
ncbi:MAG: Outer membrane protein [Marinobacter excellens HL-55]|uniref:Outer membrane protein n=1 Tax=Marinobacter excellens HL-55 TaxID=1305731 RepID=A0A0P8BG16_9GAMM|nr:MAG: Outer membrane protein [Marinobacter excellens HL-55]